MDLENSDSPNIDVLDIVHGTDSSIGILLLGVTDETEATAAASITVLDNNLQYECDISNLRRVLVSGYRDSQLLRRHQTPRTFDGEHSRQCATQGRYIL